MSWNFEGKFKLLGIKYDLSNSDTTFINYEEKIEAVKRILKPWSLRNLTYIGKVTVVKCLALPILIQLFTVLPDPPGIIIKQLEKLFFSFVWNDRKDKIKRNVLINSRDMGGLDMIHLPSFIKALKLTWIKKLVDANNTSPWKLMLIDSLEKYGHCNILLYDKASCNEISNDFNRFWKDVFISWSTLYSEPVTTSEQMLMQPIWHNKRILVNGKECYYRHWHEKDIFVIADVVDDDGSFYSFTQFREKFNLNVSFLEYYGLISAIPRDWKNIIKQSRSNVKVESELLKKLKISQKHTKYFYNIYKKTIALVNQKSQSRWREEMNVDVDWRYAYTIAFQVTNDTLLQTFQYKILHRILCTNVLLCRYGIKNDTRCSFCRYETETISHLLWYCEHVHDVWTAFSNMLNICDIRCELNPELVMFGVKDHENAEILNHCFLIIKRYIYVCRCSDTLPVFASVLRMIRNAKIVEMYNLVNQTMNRQLALRRKWNKMETFLDM